MVRLTVPAQEIVVSCPYCDKSEGVRRSGKHRGGNQRYQCNLCNKTFCLSPGTTAYPPEFKETVLKAYQERSSMYGIRRTFGISRTTLYAWLAEKK